MSDKSHALDALTLGKNPGRKLGGPQRESRRFGEEETAAEILVFGHLACNSVEVSRNKHTKKLISVLL